MPRRNLELKVRVPDLARVRSACARVATRAAVIEQVDTYFHAAHGRLKLRESVSGSEECAATLLAYDRPDRSGVRASDYHLVAVPDPAGVKSALSAALGVRGVVRKRREVHMYHNVRIHLDDVEGLGTFVELEAVVSPEADEELSLTRLDALCGLLGLSRGDGVAGSYADLLGI
jgi:predicted adenylyl cyclase CyaB